MSPAWRAPGGAAKMHVEVKAEQEAGGSRWAEVFWNTNRVRLRVRAILTQCASKQLEEENQPNSTSGSPREIVALWPICSSQLRRRSSERGSFYLLVTLNAAPHASAVRVSMH